MIYLQISFYAVVLSRVCTRSSTREDRTHFFVYSLPLPTGLIYVFSSSSFFLFFSSLRYIFPAHTHIVTAIHFPFPPSCKPPHKPTILFSGSENSEKCKMFPALIISQIIDQLDQLSSVINCTKKRYIVTSNPAKYTK